jgi:ABC-type multidrug transport system permease subunit
MRTAAIVLKVLGTIIAFAPLALWLYAACYFFYWRPDPQAGWLFVFLILYVLPGLLFGGVLIAIGCLIHERPTPQID